MQGKIKIKIKNERIRHIVARAEQYGIVIPEINFGAVIAIEDLVDCLQVQETREDTQGNWFAVLKDRTVYGQELVFGDYDAEAGKKKIAL